MLFACEELGRSGIRGLMWTPFLFLALSLPAAAGSTKTVGKRLFSFTMPDGALVVLNALLSMVCLAIAILAFKRSDLIAAGVLLFAGIWFAWRSMMARPRAS